MNTDITRRHFLESTMGAVSVLGFSLVRIPGLEQACDAAGVGALADPGAETVAEIPVIWMATGACSGCSVALLNSASPTLQELLLAQVLPGKHLSLGFHTTVMAGQGEPAMEAMDRIAREHPGGFVLVVDGATASKDEGLYCGIGEIDGKPITGYAHVRDLGREALAVLAVGECAAFGGIPAADPNPTGCLSVGQLFAQEGIATPVVNIPGCPPHPDWIVGSIATLLLGGVGALKLDELGRPAPFFRETVHDACTLRGFFERGEFAEHFGDRGCLLKLGCKGPITYADCPIRKFNGGTNWCCEAGHPCIGCCHPDFPFEQSLFAPIEPKDLGYPEAFPVVERRVAKNGDPYVAVGLIGLGGFLAGVGVTAAARKLHDGHEADEEHEEPGKGGHGGSN